MKNSREIAMHILYDIEFNGTYSNMALKSAFSKNKDIDKLDKAFITAIVYGVVSRKNTLDYIICQNSKIRIKKISKYILIILRMGIYQQKFMDKIPDSAVVNESVKLAKRYGHNASSGFVNGILRNIIKNNIVYPDDKYEKMSLEYSYPLELCKKWCNDFGQDFTKELMLSMNNTPKMCVRVNTLKTTPEIILKDNNFIQSYIYENALYANGFDVSSSKLYNDGHIYPQDISAMMASVILNPKQGDRVLDICASPGGKTTHIAQLMNNEGHIVACDLYKHKIDLINKNAERLGISIIKAIELDATQYNHEFESSFDKVMCDVPCSGYGVIRRKPDIKWKSADNNDLINTAEQILTNASRYVKIGGELLFSTCTINKEENELRLNEFLKENKNFEPVDISVFLNGDLYNETAKNGYVTFYPNINGVDGFFIAKIKRCK